MFSFFLFLQGHWKHDFHTFLANMAIPAADSCLDLFWCQCCVSFNKKSK